MNAEMGEQHATATGASFMRVDVSNADEVAKSIEQVVADHGALHIAVNCAGIGPAAKTVSRGEASARFVFKNYWCEPYWVVQRGLDCRQTHGS